MSYLEACRSFADGRVPYDALEEIGGMFADVGTRLEADDEAWRPLWELELVRAISYLGVPSRFNPYPLTQTGALSAELHFSVIEILARFDVSTLMALPGPSLSGHIVNALGTEQQITNFFGDYARKATRAFLAATEPTTGSDLDGISSKLRRHEGNWLLDAEKMLVGGISPDGKGLVLARWECGPEKRFAMLDLSQATDHISVQRIRSVGLAGAQLGRISITGLPLEPKQILGGHTADRRAGIYQLKNVFQRHRPMVAAMALGTARGALAALQTLGARQAAIDLACVEYQSLRRWLMEFGRGLDNGKSSFYEASLLKLSATRFAERVARTMHIVLPPKTFLLNPALTKRYRDLLAFEYMEGTSNIQKMNAYHSYLYSRYES